MLQVRELTLSYGHKKIFDNLNHDFLHRGITAIVGPSGCGKTSFLNVLNRIYELEPQTNVTGKVLFHQQNILQVKDIIAVRQKIAMIFQRPVPLPCSIFKNYSIPLKELGYRDKNDILAIIKQTLNQVGLWDELQNRLKEDARLLSGGQAQRLCLGRALALKPEILLLDEPCSALDPLSTELIEQLLLELKKQMTIIIVTHNLAQAKRIADEVLLFWNAGETAAIIEKSNSHEFFNNPRHQLTQRYVQGLSG